MYSRCFQRDREGPRGPQGLLGLHDLPGLPVPGPQGPQGPQGLPGLVPNRQVQIGSSKLKVATAA